MVEFVEIEGPDWAASYLVNGDASGLEDGDQEKVDAWLAREGIARVVSIKNPRNHDSRGHIGFTFQRPIAAAGVSSLTSAK